MTSIVCLVASLFVAGFWFAVYRIKRHTENSTCRLIRKAILESLKDGPLERSKVVDWLEDRDVCTGGRAGCEIDDLIGDGLIEESDPLYETGKVAVGHEAEEEMIVITPKGKEKLCAWGKKKR